MGLLMTEFKTTPGSPLSCRAESWEGSWKMKAVVTSVAVMMRGERKDIFNGNLCTFIIVMIPVVLRINSDL